MDWWRGRNDKARRTSPGWWAPKPKRSSFNQGCSRAILSSVNPFALCKDLEARSQRSSSSPLIGVVISRRCSAESGNAGQAIVSCCMMMSSLGPLSEDRQRRSSGLASSETSLRPSPRRAGWPAKARGYGVPGRADFLVRTPQSRVPSRCRRPWTTKASTRPISRTGQAPSLSWVGSARDWCVPKPIWRSSNVSRSQLRHRPCSAPVHPLP
ncbi:hypothetical protein LX36DRAFT_416787 [Colletotrichum falcatum]|nr:hypothetical protein LX36DRAFT_416787 [Colletotrichum falcatum]